MEPWDHYRTFLAIARGGTLAAAAEALDSSISTVHRQLATLEQTLDTRLFERRGRGQVLTEAGEALIERAARIEAEVLAIERDVAGRDEALRGSVVLTTTDTFADMLLRRHLPVLRERHPEIQLHVLVDNRHHRLGRGEADVALRPGSKPVEPDVVARQVAELSYAWYAARSYLDRHGRPRRRRDLRRHDVIAVDDSLMHVVFGKAAIEHTDPARWVLRSPSLLVQATAVRSGAGVAALPCFLMDDEPEVERLFTPEPEGPLWLLYHAALRGTARVRAVIEFLHERIERDRELLRGSTQPGNLHAPMRVDGS